MPTEGTATFAFGLPAPDGAALPNPFAGPTDPNRLRCERMPAACERTGDNADPDLYSATG